MLSGYDAYINACSSDDNSREICKCEADFLALQLPDEQILELTVATTKALQGRDDRLREMAQNHPEIVVAVEKLERQAAVCEDY